MPPLETDRRELSVLTNGVFNTTPSKYPDSVEYRELFPWDIERLPICNNIVHMQQ